MRADVLKAVDDSIQVVFLSSSLFFVLAAALAAYPYGTLGVAAFTFAFCAGMVALAWISANLEKKVSIPVAVLLIAFMYAASISRFFYSVALALFLLGFPFAWFKSVEKKTFGEALSLLFITKERLLWNAVVGCCMAIFLIYPIVLLEVLAFRLIGITDITNVGNLILAAPWWVAVFSFTIAPVAEEIFFRGFLVPRAGIVIPALLFSLAHYTYGSVVEFAGAFTIGLLFGVLLLRTKSIVSVIAAHAMFNLVSISIIYFGSWFG